MTAEKKKSNKLMKIWNWIQSPFTIGIVITTFFILFAQDYYQIRNQNDNTHSNDIIFQIINLIDSKTTDFRFRLRGPQEPTTKIALLAIDDRSVEQMGRWPWSREKTGELVDKIMQWGGRVIGFDIVFSEPQIDPRFSLITKLEQGLPSLQPATKAMLETEKLSAQPDMTFGQVVKKYQEKLVLGAFHEETFSSVEPYQEYCINEAYKRTAQFKVIENETLLPGVLFEQDYFASLTQGKGTLTPVIKPIFEGIEENTKNALVKKFNKLSYDVLSDQEKAHVRFAIETEIIDYCSRWLIPSHDEYMSYFEYNWKFIMSEIKELRDLPFQQSLAKFKEENFKNPVVHAGRLTTNTAAIQENATHTGLFNAELDEDGTIRRSPLFYYFGDGYIPSLALQTFLVGYNKHAEIKIGVDPKTRTQKIIKEFKIVDNENDQDWFFVPTDGQGRLKINYRGPQKTFPYLPVKELFTDSPQAKIIQKVYNPELKSYVEADLTVDKAEFIKDRAFIFGATAIGIYDLRVTPFENNTPGPETHLTTLDNLLTRDFIQVHPHEEKVMMIFLALFGLIFSALITFLSSLWAFFATALAGIGIYTFDRFFLFKNGYVATTALPAILVFFLYLFLTLYKYFTEERKKQHLRATFSKYVSPAIVDEILEDPANIELGGRKQRMSVFFSDVRGFTTISEKLDPQVLSQVLNEYLTPMTEIVFQNKGTLDKYMGDAVMAFFGAPISYSDHAKYACRCALQSLEKLKEIQASFKERGMPNIDIGIGINTSEMSVGNMGSDIVRNYTVMGDAVNLGSRLEGINKEYGTRIIISEFTYADVQDSFTAREIDWVKVKGKNKPVRIYELMGEGKPSEETEKFLQHFQAGFNLYHEKKFQEASDEFQKALSVRNEDPVSKLYVERCQDYLSDPPPEDWDGVFTMKTK